MRGVSDHGTAAKKCVCGVDLGKVRVGVAVSDELGALAHPRPALDGTNRKALLAGLAALAAAEEVGRFVVGLPVEMSGSHGAAAERAEKFALALANATGLEVELWDERLTTVEASRRLSEAGKRKRSQQASIDSAAAALLLQAWLDRRGR
jgi:putative Holliday junction resolvase